MAPIHTLPSSVVSIRYIPVLNGVACNWDACANIPTDYSECNYTHLRPSYIPCSQGPPLLQVLSHNCASHRPPSEIKPGWGVGSGQVWRTLLLWQLGWWYFLCRRKCLWLWVALLSIAACVATMELYLHSESDGSLKILKQS